MTREADNKRAWGLMLIAVWLLINGVPLLIIQVLRIAGVELQTPLELDPGFLALDDGFVIMDVAVAGPVYILGAVLLLQRRKWGSS